jgi:hypothetical protein
MNIKKLKKIPKIVHSDVNHSNTLIPEENELKIKLIDSLLQKLWHNKYGYMGVMC